jgi:integrase
VEQPATSRLTFRELGAMFVESYGEGRQKISWNDDEYMVRQLVRFQVNGACLGDKPVNAVTEPDLEAFVQSLARAGRSVATQNHFVRVIKSLSAWLVRKGYRASLLTGESDVIRRRKATKRRLEPDEETRLLQVSGPHLQRLIMAALETCCRLGELLSLQWREVSLARNEIVIRADKAKTGTARTIPISTRLRAVLELVRDDPHGKPFPPTAYVFGNEAGERVKCVRRAWETAILKAHGHAPTWAWRKGKTRKGTGRLSPESRALLQAIDLHFHDLRHEAGSRLIEAGWPLHEVQQMLGHASLEQTSTYLNATLRGLHRSMRAFDQARGFTESTVAQAPKSDHAGIPCEFLANTPACDALAPCSTTPASDAKLLVN